MPGKQAERMMAGLIRGLLLALAAWGTAAAAQTAPAPGPAPARPYTADMMTRWGRQVTPANAWRSYPRPQMKRNRWLNLNGQWTYAIRPKAAAEPSAPDGRILVPFAVESRLSGVNRTVTPNDRVWYGREFTVPADWQGQRVLLHFGGVDFETQVLVNGAIVGSHRGGNTAFSFDVTDYLRPGANRLSVQVTDPTSAGAQPRGKQELNPNGIWYTPVSGIWQTVWLEPVPDLHVEDVVLTPDVDRGELAVTVALNRSATDQDAVRITASSAGRRVASVTVRANRAARLPIPDAHLWSPDDPFLYDLKVELLRVASPIPGGTHRRELEMTAQEAALYAPVTGTARDTVDGYFAMRKVSIGPGPVAGQPAILLNNRPLFQNGTLDQGWWPDGLLTPPSEEAIRWEIAWLKSAGFNMLRKHIKVEPGQYYLEADRQGLLIWQDMPSGEEADSHDQFVRPESQREAVLPQATENAFTWELGEMVRQLRNHPSIVTWVVNNEGWGQFASTRLARYVHDLDPSRLVNKTSGWLDTGASGSDLYDIHTYEEVPTVPARQADRAVVLGEFGGIGLPVEGHLWFPDRRNWGYQTASDAADYRRRYQRKYAEVIRQWRDLGLSAAVYTQTTDVEGEINGLLTYDRAQSKLPPEEFRRIHAPLFGTRP
jgi:beta-galactosidase/beta-glucuronidase